MLWIWVVLGVLIGVEAGYDAESSDISPIACGNFSSPAPSWCARQNPFILPQPPSKLATNESKAGEAYVCDTNDPFSRCLLISRLRSLQGIGVNGTVVRAVALTRVVNATTRTSGLEVYNSNLELLWSPVTGTGDNGIPGEMTLFAVANSWNTSSNASTILVAYGGSVEDIPGTNLCNSIRCIYLLMVGIDMAASGPNGENMANSHPLPLGGFVLRGFDSDEVFPVSINGSACLSCVAYGEPGYGVMMVVVAHVVDAEAVRASGQLDGLVEEVEVGKRVLFFIAVVRSSPAQPCAFGYERCGGIVAVWDVGTTAEPLSVASASWGHECSLLARPLPGEPIDLAWEQAGRRAAFSSPYGSCVRNSSLLALGMGSRVVLTSVLPVRNVSIDAYVNASRRVFFDTGSDKVKISDVGLFGAEIADVRSEAIQAQNRSDPFLPQPIPSQPLTLAVRLSNGSLVVRVLPDFSPPTSVPLGPSDAGLNPALLSPEAVQAGCLPDRFFNQTSSQCEPRPEGLVHLPVSSQGVMQTAWRSPSPSVAALLENAGCVPLSILCVAKAVNESGILKWLQPGILWPTGLPSKDATPEGVARLILGSMYGLRHILVVSESNSSLAVLDALPTLSTQPLPASTHSSLGLEVQQVNSLDLLGEPNDVQLTPNAQFLFAAVGREQWELSSMERLTDVCAARALHPHDPFLQPWEPACTSSPPPRRPAVQDFVQTASVCVGGTYCPSFDSEEMQSLPAGRATSYGFDDVLCAAGSFCQNGRAQQCPTGFDCPDPGLAFPQRCSSDPLRSTNCYTTGLTSPEIAPQGFLTSVPYLPAFPAPPGYAQLEVSSGQSPSNYYFMGESETSKKYFMGESETSSKYFMGESETSSKYFMGETSKTSSKYVMGKSSKTSSKYSESSRRSLAPCSSGEWCGLGATVGMDECPAGTFCSNATVLEPIDCHALHPPGASEPLMPYCPNGSVANLPCPPGYYCPSIDKARACSPGTMCLAGSAVWRACPAGLYCQDPGDPKPCPEGHFCPAGSASPIVCGAFTVCKCKDTYSAPTGEKLPMGCTVPQNFSAPVILGGIAAQVAILWGIGWYVQRRRRQQRDKQLQELQAAEKDGQSQSDHSMPLLPSASHELDESRTRVDVSFRNLGLKLRKTGVHVLQGVTGTLHAGRVCAVMGPSGAGKSSFLAALAGKARGYAESTGSVYVNGQEGGLERIRDAVGFVPQDDIVAPDLTVEENLRYAADMRLPTHLSETDRLARVAHVLELLGLASIADSLVGDEHKRGISGGQKKRVNIGVELVADPTVLLLDEPTSGLDSSAARDVCEALQKIAREGITVAAVVHQPRWEVFAAFDDLLLLAPGGRTAYMGPGGDAVIEFLQRPPLSRTLPRNVNPADVLIDAIATPELADACVAAVEESLENLSSSPSSGTSKSHFSGSSPMLAPSSIQDDSGSSALPARRILPSTMRLLFLIWKRSVLQCSRNLLPPLVYAALAVVAAGVLGWVYASEPSFSPPAPPEAFVGCPAPVAPECRLCLFAASDRITGRAIMAVISLGLLGVATFAPMIADSKVLYWREASWMPQPRHTIAWFVGRDAAMVPLLLFVPSLFIVTYAALTTPRASMWQLYAVTAGTYFAASGLGHLVAAATPRATAQLAAVIIVFGLASFAGAAPTLPQLYSRPAPLKWLPWISFLRYALEGMYIAEARPYIEVAATQNLSLPEHAISIFGFHLHLQQLWTVDFTALMAWGIGFRILAVLILILTDRDKKM